jgi:hypothetical protein
MNKYLRWIFWKGYYAAAGMPTAIGPAWMKWAERTRPPYWKFKPNLYRSEEGRRWEVTLDGESDYSQRGSIKCDLHIGRDSGRIVGFSINDEDLAPLLAD